MTSDPGAPVSPRHGPAEAGERRWLVLSLLTLSMMVSFADRSALSMLIQPIKLELGLSDTRIGILTGFAFAAFYAVFGIIMARVSDRGWHREVIIGSLVVWSIMTALCGAAQSFVQILAARFGVGAGEAGVVPASQAMVGSMFPETRRSTALGILMAGGPIGILVAFAVTGPMEASFGWRMTFVLYGVPGLLLAVVALIALRPTNRAERGAGAKFSAHDLAQILRRPAYRQVLLAIVALNLLAFGQTQWLPAYMERSFDVPRVEVGPLLAITQGVGMLAGSLIGGPLFDLLGRRDPRWRPRLLMASVLVGSPLLIGVYSVPHSGLAASLAGAGAFALAIPSGYLWYAVQGSVPPQQRATGAALVMLTCALLGMGLGPVAIGALSDLLHPSLGAQSLRIALLFTVAAGGLWMFAHVALLNRVMPLLEPADEDA